MTRILQNRAERQQSRPTLAAAGKVAPLTPGARLGAVGFIASVPAKLPVSGVRASGGGIPGRKRASHAGSLCPDTIGI